METIQTDGDLAVEWVATDAVYPNPANPRVNDAAVGPVADSLRRFGWQQPIVAKDGGEVVAGHTRLRAAKQLGMERVPVLRFNGSDIDAVAFGIADNRTATFAEWDEPALAKLLAQLQVEDALEGVGFTEQEVALLLRAQEDEVDEDDGPGEVPEDPVSKAGDLWILRDQRILCGDATRAEDMARLMGDDKAALLATDPPYLVNYDNDDGAEDHWDAYTGDEAGVEFFLRFLHVALPHCRTDVPVYHWHAHRRQALVQAAWEKAGLLLHQQIIWTKARGTFGRSHFAWAHEPCFYGWPKGKMPAKERRPPASETTVWGIGQVGQLDGVHPTQKPLEVFLRPMRFHTLSSEIVLEPFSGSGSQIIAAERLGRACRAMELDPGYVDVAVQRWEKVSGEKARLESGGTFAQVAEERSAE